MASTSPLYDQRGSAQAHRHAAALPVGAQELCLEDLEAKLLLRRNELDTRKAFVLCQVLDALRSPSASRALAPSLRRLAVIVLDFVAIAGDPDLLSTALEVIACAKSLVDCGGNEAAATEFSEFLLRRAWLHLQTAPGSGPLAEVAIGLMRSLAHKDPMAVAKATASGTAFLDSVLSGLADARAAHDAAEVGVAAVSLLWSCHLRYPCASTTKSLLIDRAPRIHALVLRCQLRPGSSTRLKVSCSDFMIGVLESTPALFDHRAAPEFAPSERDGRHGGSGTLLSLLALAAKDCLVSPDEVACSNGVRMAAHLLGRTESSVDPDFADHVVNLARRHALWHREGSGSNLLEAQEAALVGTLGEAVSRGGLPDSCLVRAADACAMWLRASQDLSTPSFALDLLEVVGTCLSRLASPQSAWEASPLRILQALEGQVMRPRREEASPTRACSAALRVLERMAAACSISWRGDGTGSPPREVSAEEAEALARTCGYVVCLADRLARGRACGADALLPPSQEESAEACIASALSAMAEARFALSRAPERRDLLACIQPVCAGFRDLLIPLALQQPIGPLTGRSLLSAMLAFTSRVAGEGEGPAELLCQSRALAAQIFASDAIFVLLGLGTRSENASRQASVIVRRLVASVTGKAPAADFVGHLACPERPLSSILEGILANCQGAELCDALCDSMVLASCVLYTSGTTGENRELAAAVCEVASRSDVQPHNAVALHCAALLGFLGGEDEVVDLIGLGTRTPDEVVQAVDLMPTLAHVGLLALFSRAREPCQVEQDALLLCVFRIAGNQDVPFCKLFEFASVDGLVRLATRAMEKALRERLRLEPQRICHVIHFVADLCESTNFRECLFGEDFIVLALRFLKSDPGQGAPMPTAWREAIAREVFCLLLRHAGGDDQSGASCCWLPFLRGVQDIAVASEAKEGDEGSASPIPMDLLHALLPRVLTSAAMVGEVAPLVRLCVASADSCLISGEEAVSGAVLFLDRVAGLEREHLVRARDEAGLAEDAGLLDPADNDDGDVWGGKIDFVRLVCAVGSLLRDGKVAALNGSLLSLAVSLLHIWRDRKGGEAGGAVHTITDEFVHTAHDLLVSSHQVLGGSPPSAPATRRVAAIECIRLLVSSETIHASVRRKIACFPWNEPIFQAVLTSSYNGAPGSLGSALSRELLEIVLAYGSGKLGSPPRWLLAFLRRNHHLLMIVCEGAEGGSGKRTRAMAVSELARW